MYILNKELFFPPVEFADEDGMFAIGGDLSTERLLLAYRSGIFPWYNEDQPILWWWTSPRLMIQPNEVRISHSLRNILNQNTFHVTFNSDFVGVIHGCKEVKRKNQDGTWIMPEIIDAFTDLHRLGYAHSVEVYKNEKFVGGLYGMALGKIFFGESMFAVEPNASKVAFVHLCRHLQLKGFDWIDCQQDTPHMRSFGGRLIESDDFLNVLRENQLFMLGSDKPSEF